MSTSASPSALRETPLRSQHVALGARMVPFAGWEMPVQYSGVTEEHRAVREAAGLFDVSHMGELVMDGEYSDQVVNYLITNDASRLTDGQALYTASCNPAGTILDDLIVYRIAKEKWLIVCNAGNHDKMSAHFAKAAEHHCRFEDVSDKTAMLALQGPKALAVAALAGGDGPDLGKLAAFHFRDAVLANVRCTVARTGYTGEDGVEIFCASSDAPQLWTTLIELGRPLGLLPCGLAARDTLRLEARLSLYGNDIDETTNPIEAGLGWVVKLDKGDFVGRDAIARVKAEGPIRKMVGFEMTGRGIARHGYPLLDKAGATIGICTSGGPAPTVGKNIGLGYVPSATSAVGTEIAVDCRGKSIDAKIVKTPFYKRAQ